MDFVSIDAQLTRSGVYEIAPHFKVRKTKDLMIKGSDFYAVWDERNTQWSMDIQTVVDMVDYEISVKAKELKDKGFPVRPMYMEDADSKSIDKFNHYCKKQMYDQFHEIDGTITFADSPREREMYSSKRLSYSMREGPIEHYEALASKLYSPEEREKFEWAIGSVIAGDAKWIQKFLVFVGDHGTGKSTILKIIRLLFEDYCGTIDAKALGNSNNTFALDVLRTNPLVAIQDDTDLSKIEDNTRINSLVSHEPMTVSEKYKSSYTQEFHCMVFLGTNREVRITDSRSGLIRRLIDVKPTGEKFPPKVYREHVAGVEFELGAIAQHCYNVYDNDPYRYETYVPIEMMSSTNVVYSFLEENLAYILNADGISLNTAYKLYNDYCDKGGFQFKLDKQKLRNELKGYFMEFIVDGRLSDGTRVYNYFKGFKKQKMGMVEDKQEEVIEDDIPDTESDWLELGNYESMLDFALLESDVPAQLSTGERPLTSWAKCKTTIGDLDTSKEHYCKLPDRNWIFIDFDCRDENGNKNLQKCLEAARKFPKTYAEVSKGGQGLHLHYIYDGDPSMLSALYDDHIEIKVLKGDMSCRRRLSLCNNLPVNHISSGLPLREEAPKVKNEESLANAKALATLIERALKKTYPPHSTICNVEFINKSLEDAYRAGMSYDMRPYRPRVARFADNSTNNAFKCSKMVQQMKWCSDDYLEPQITYVAKKDILVFYDVEVFPNLLVVVWKMAGPGNIPITWINPTPEQIDQLMEYKLVGFNNRKYDNHIIYGVAMGYTREQTYRQSKTIISGTPKDQYSANGFFSDAYGLSYTDIYDYSKDKMSLKKWEIKLGIHHQELGLDWNEPVPEELWEKVAEYCVNDVLATEAVFNATQGDFVAREILASLTGGTPNDTTNTLSAKLIFGNNRHPQGDFLWRDLSKPVNDMDGLILEYFEEIGLNMPFDENSLLPYFPGYKFENGRSTYRGETVGEGGYVYAEPGIHYNVALIDIVSMHPHSAMAECIFGHHYTRIFRELVLTRVAIKNGDFETARKLFDGRLAPFLDDESKADDIAQALKIVINSVYGLTSAHFENRFRDPNNIDNIVAKRGALFMIDLKNAVQERGFTVAHIKTDSIKIPNATPEIIEFCKEFAQRYGYTFDHEATYEKMCLVNDAVYIAKYGMPDVCESLYGYVPKDCKKHPGEWTATGTQFAVPYVFKTLFSNEPITFEDVCETKSVKNALYLDTGTEEEPKYQFIGRVGQFTPVVEGVGGGKLMSLNNGKYSSATGTKGYLWLESETLRNRTNAMEFVDKRYYRALVDKARDAIFQFGDVDEFINCSPYAWIRDADLPF